jgi:benzodiazapine receptor
MFDEKEWYNSLKKPEFQPPDWVFTPAWTILYILMFTALFLVLIAQFRWIHILAYLFFIIQLTVNLSWPFVFFKEHNLRKAFLYSSLLSLLVFITMLLFFYISKWAGILFIPYFLWCLFANILSFEILELNE